jgi:hypothetical protein
MFATIQDFFVFAFPAVILLVIAMGIEFIARPTVDRPVPPPMLYGLLPSALYVVAAAILVFPQLGRLVAQ